MTTKRTFLLCLIVSVAAAAAANPLPVCGWEECDEAVLWIDGPGSEPILATRATAPDPVMEGNHSLKLVHNAPGATPRACIAFAEGVAAGAQIHLDVSVYNAVPGNGSYQIRGRYLPDDLDAGGPEDPGGAGWQWITHSWQMVPGQSGLAVYVEMPGEAGQTVWLDVMVLMPEAGRFTMPCWDEVVPVEGSTLSAVKDLFR